MADRTKDRISDQALSLFLSFSLPYFFLVRSARPRGNEVNGTIAPWSILLASCKRVCWPWNQWKYFMDRRQADTHTQANLRKPSSLNACTYIISRVSYAQRLASFETIAVEARPELGLCPLCLENRRLGQSDPSDQARPDEKDLRTWARPTSFSSCVFRVRTNKTFVYCANLI